MICGKPSRLAFQTEKWRALQSEHTGPGRVPETRTTSGSLVAARTLQREGRMLDLIAVAATIVFFLISLAYVRGCEKL
jgi:hypothetical protein